MLDGRSRAEAAELNGMDRQTLSDWVHRYNVDGIDGLKSRHLPGAAPRLSEAQRAELRELVVAGPDPEKGSLRGKRKRASWDENYLKALLALF